MDINIVAFLELPLQPFVQRAIVLESRIANYQHFDWRIVQVRVVGVDISYSPTIEQLCINGFKSRAVSPEQHVLGGLGVSAVEVNGDFNVVEHTDGVVDRVVAHGLDGHRAELHTAHRAFHTYSSYGFSMQATRLVGSLIHDEGHVFRLLVFTHRRLARHQSLHIVVFKTVVRRAVARDFDTRVGTERHGDELVDDGNLRIAYITAKDGVGQAEPREGPTFTFIVLCLDG